MMSETAREASAPETPVSVDANPDPKQALMDQIIAAIKTCYDPEIPVDIWELGLIYRLDVNAAGEVEVDMTLTSPMCPVAGDLPPYVQGRVQAVEGVTACKLNLVWEPPWRMDMMSDEAKLELDLF